MKLLINRRAVLKMCSLPIATLSLPGGAQAQDATQKTLKLMVGYPAGSTSDIVARVLAPHLSKGLGQAAIVENKAGADGQIAALEVLRAPANGSTLFVATNSPLAAVPALRKVPPYDAMADFTPIGFIGRYIHFLVVSPDLPVKNVADLLGHARANPGGLSYAAGATFHKVATAQFLRDAGIRMNEVPYKGEPAALIDLMAGRVQFMLASQGVVLEFIRSGKVRALATTANERHASVQDVPTLKEAGLPTFAVMPWVGLFGPPGLPKAMIENINGELRVALQQADVREQLDRIGIEASASTPAEMGKLLGNQLEIWHRSVQEFSIEKT